MSPENLDRTDRAILHLLQGDARNVTTAEIAEAVGVSSSTAAARIADMEETGVVTGYDPIVDYRKAGFDQHLLVVGTASPDRRGEIVEQVVEVRGVVSVRELATDAENVAIELLGESQDAVERRLEELTDLGVEILRTEVLKATHDRPFDGFGEQFVE